MGIFSSIFKKKSDAQGDPQDLAGDPAFPRASRAGEPSRIDSEAERQRQREVARATAMKIDAIESAMTSDIFHAGDAIAARRAPRPAPFAGDDADGHPTLPMLEMATTELLGEADEADKTDAADAADEPGEPGGVTGGAASGSASSAAAGAAPPLAAPAPCAPVIEEVAILYANGQLALAEHMLVDCLGDVGRTERAVWWMLFDLYQIDGQRAAFDKLSIDYASHFETSPPPWAGDAPVDADGGPDPSVPALRLAGMLDEAASAPLAQWLHAATERGAAQLALDGVDATTAQGCADLAAALAQLRAGAVRLNVSGVDQLAQLLRAGIAPGDRDASEAPWLLLLALLQLLGQEQAFEAAAMDYCVTYEVSPPSFDAPDHAAVASAAPPATPPAAGYPLPAQLDGGTKLDGIEQHAAAHDTLVFDCARLQRIDYGAANTLLARLRPLAEAGTDIEFRALNHLVAALFRLLGYAEIASLLAHKY